MLGRGANDLPADPQFDQRGGKFKDPLDTLDLQRSLASLQRIHRVMPVFRYAKVDSTAIRIDDSCGECITDSNERGDCVFRKCQWYLAEYVVHDSDGLDIRSELPFASEFRVRAIEPIQLDDWIKAKPLKQDWFFVIADHLYRKVLRFYEPVIEYGSELA